MQQLHDLPYFKPHGSSKIHRKQYHNGTGILIIDNNGLYESVVHTPTKPDIITSKQTLEQVNTLLEQLHKDNHE